MHQFNLLVLLMMVVLSGNGVVAGQAAFTDPSKAGPDFKVQGEYLGEFNLPEGKTVYSLEIVAKSEGKFLVVGYPGGLRGAGAQIFARGTGWGKTLDGVTSFAADNGKSKGILRGRELVVTNVFGEEFGVAKRVDRSSPTLGAQPPHGALVLFSGDGNGQFADGRMGEGGVLEAGATSNERFRDCIVHLEFRVPFMPAAKGQERGNSGVYLQGRYEIQILDSFGLEAQKDTCGAIYEIAVPRCDMSFPPLSWQTYDVTFTAARFDREGQKTSNARVTVMHNGILIHDDVEIPDVTPGGPVATESTEPGPLFLQDHGCPVQFRNIWIVETK